VTESNERRVPVYILADTSGSMVGAPIETLNNHLKIFKDILMSDPYAYETAWVSLITFGGDDAKVVCPLTKIKDFEPPFFEASGRTPLGDAMKKLNECIDKEVRLRDKNHVNDYKPLVYVLTDGRPTDDGWHETIEAVKERTNRKVAVTFTLGCGPEVDEDVLKLISSGKNDFAIKVEEMTPEMISTFFQAISQSIGNVAKEGVFDKKEFKEEFGADVLFIE
jgi:uncharacterized protein YegL